LFGGFWGSIIGATSTLFFQAWQHQPAVKLVFNVAQRTLSIAVGSLVYVALGGSLPPAYLSGVGLQSPAARQDLGFFFFLASAFFLINAFALNTVVALSSGRKFNEVWNLNTKGVLGYDIAASTLAIVLAWLYVGAEHAVGLGAIGLVVVIAPLLVIRHVYGLYRRLQNSGRELLDLMVKAIEARDPYTSGHSVRVATLAKAIASEAKLPAEEVEEVYTAALLHDVGKIHEEFAPLLRKETKLTPEETALLQTHALKSAELVGIISSFRGRVQEAVRSHHERWDGGGYPDGLSGEQIPLGARIIMISDTADAMTTDRPYRKRLPMETVIAELQKYKGSQFDPRLVDLTVTSVGVRRVMSELQIASNGKEPPAAQDGGSKRVALKAPGLLRGRTSWSRLRAF
jgi:putative nucleotidyltransferase with HDIG domain